jgi:hypothetical protein
MNRKWSTATLGVATVVALVLGFVIPKILSPAPARVPKAASQMKAVINRNSSDNSCQQYAGSDFGHVVKYAFPLLTKGGDTIVWHGEVDGGSPVKVHVEFPPGQSPFGNREKFDEGRDSGPVSNLAAPKDYPFLLSAVTVDGTPCSSFTDPGVHVDP